MSELNPCKRAIEVTDKIMKLLEEEKITLSEAGDIPMELQRRISRNIHCLKNENVINADM